MDETSVTVDLVDDPRLHREEMRLVSVETGEDLMRQVSSIRPNGAGQSAQQHFIGRAHHQATFDHRLEDDMDDQRLGIEGYQESRWIVLDYGTVVIHLFDDETREYYDLEGLWADATHVDLSGLQV